MLERIYPQSAAIQLCCYDSTDDNEEPIYASPFVLTFEDILVSREQHPEIKNLKHFDKDLVKEAGMMPIPDIPNPMAEDFLHLSETKAGLTESEATMMAFSIWQLIQKKNYSKTIQQILKLDNRLMRVLPQLSNFINNCPRWMFSGYSSEDIFRKNGGLSDKPEFSFGPNILKAGYKKEELKQMADKAWDDYISDKD